MAILLPPVDHTPETWPQGVRQGPPNWPDAPAGTGEMPEFPERAPDRKDDLFLRFMAGVSLPLATLRTSVQTMAMMPELEEVAPIIDDARRLVLGQLGALQSRIETGRDYCEGSNLFFFKEALVGLAERGVPRGLIPPEARALIADLEDRWRASATDTEFRYRPRQSEHLAYWKTLAPWTFARVVLDDLAAWYSEFDAITSELEFAESIEQNTVAAGLAVLYAMDPRLSPERARCKFMPSVFYSDLEPAELKGPEPSDSPFVEAPPVSQADLTIPSWLRKQDRPESDPAVSDPPPAE